jgi:hypothetical protein
MVWWHRLQQQMQAPSQQGVASVGRRCYIMNLAWETTWQTLKDHFRQVSVSLRRSKLTCPCLLLLWLGCRAASGAGYPDGSDTIDPRPDVSC